MAQTTANLTLSLARSGGVALGLSLSTGPSMVPGVASSAGTSTAAGVGAARWAAAGLAGGTSTAAGAGRAAGPAVVAAAILARSPIAYWKLDETSGAVAADSSGNGRDGAYSASGLTLGGSFAPFVAPTFNGTNGIVNIHSASFNGAFSGDVGTLLAFVRAGTAGTRSIIRLNGTSPSALLINRIAGNQYLLRRTDDASTSLSVNRTAVDAVWEMVALTYTRAGDQLIGYANGAAATPLGGLDAFIGPLSSTGTLIGGTSTSGATARWLGEIAHVAIFPTALSAADIAAIYAASGL